VPEFCHNFLTFSATPKVNIDIYKLAEKLVPIPTGQVPLAIQRALSTPVTHKLHQRKDIINYRALHLGHEVKKDIKQAPQDVKQKCKL